MNSLKSLFPLLLGIISVFIFSCSAESKVIWQIGKADNHAAEFALAPTRYKQFLKNDFGWEDRYFLIGQSDEQKDFPYVLPGPSDEWGGTWGTSGWRSHSLNILFGIDQLPKSEEWKLIIDLFDINDKDSTVFKVSINGKSWKYRLPKGSGKNSIEDSTSVGKEFVIEIPIESKLIKMGGNEISLTTLQGSWLIFDHIRLEGSGNTQLTEIKKVFLRNVKAANYEI